MQAAFKDIAERSQKLLAGVRRALPGRGPQRADPLHLTQTFMDFTAKMLADPNKLAAGADGAVAQYMKLWQATAQRMMGQTVEPVAEPAKGDKRFADPAWKDEVVFDYLKQSYLLTARWLQGTVKEVEGIDAKTAPEGRVLHAPVRRRAVAVQLRAHQSAGREGDRRKQGREPAQRPAATC